MTQSYVACSEKLIMKLMCRGCLSYISKSAPGSDDKIFCQRCYGGETVIPNYSNQLFPCIFRFDGCDQLLYPSQVEKHENRCRGNDYKCTECSYTGCGTQLYHHYILCHDENVLRDDTIKLDLMQKFERVELVLRLYVVHFGNPSGISFAFDIKSPKRDERCYSVSRQVCQSVTTFRPDEVEKIEIEAMTLIIATGGSNLLCVLKVFADINTTNPNTHTMSVFTNPSQEIMDRAATALQQHVFPNYFCGTCGAIVLPPVMRCSAKHLRCEDCSKDSSYCFVCQAVTEWSPANEVEPFLKNMPLPCRWNCNELFFFDQLRIHEKDCTKRKYDCPIKSCSWKGSLVAFYCNHAKIHENIKVFRGVVCIPNRDAETSESYLISNKELFYFRLGSFQKVGRWFHFRKVSQFVVKEREYYGSIRIGEEKLQLTMGAIKFIPHELEPHIYILFSVSSI